MRVVARRAAPASEVNPAPPPPARSPFFRLSRPPLQDAAFCETAHRRVKVPAHKLTWFRDRRLGEISLGSLLLTSLMRTVSVTSGLSMAGASDSYLHTNCFAAAANMAPYTENLHTFSAQRMLSTLSALHKKHVYLASRARDAPAGSDDLARVNGLVEHYDQCLRIGCETLLAMCAPALLPRNVSLLYGLLRERSVIDSLAADGTFSDGTVRALSDVITHFDAVITKAEAARAIAIAKGGSGGAEEVAAAAAGAPIKTAVPWSESDVFNELTVAAKAWSAGADAEKAATSLMDMKFLCVV